MRTLATANDMDVGFKPASLDELLVQLHDVQNRYKKSAAADMGIARQRIVQTVADIVETEFSTRERDMVADVLLNLFRQAEKDLRESLSARLCIAENIPDSLILFLAHDVITVAKPVLEYSPCLTANDLMYIIQSKGKEYWQAIARRRELESEVIGALAVKKDEGTAFNLLNNKSSPIPGGAIEIFAELAKYSQHLAEPLLARPEIPRNIATELYWHVSQNLRARIVEQFSIPKQKLDEALQDALQDFEDTAAHVAQPRPSALMTDLARQYKRLNRITDAMLVTTLRRGQLRFFLGLFAERTGLGAETVLEMMRQVGGQGMAVACRATGVSKENFVSLFLLSRSLARGDRAVDALELRKAMKYYDVTTESLAAKILSNTVHA